MTFLLLYLFLHLINANNLETLESGQCTVENREKCKEGAPYEANAYKEESNVIYYKVQSALKDYKPCSADTNDVTCDCHAEVISSDLQPYEKDGVTKQMLTHAAKYGTRYKILQHRLYRDADCMFPARCLGIEHFLLNLLPELPDMDLVVNTRDWPQLRAAFGATRGPVFSFSKTNEYLDIMYPAWTFWAGGPAISLHPTGIGRWDLLRESISQTAKKIPWADKRSIGFFRGSRTSDERDSLVLLSRRRPDLVDAQYTKNQAWKSPKDTLNAEPAEEVSFEHHCRYKYLFNFRGVAASFRLKHLFLCKSLVFHVGDEWNEFFYFALKPWVHYVPLNNYPNEDDLENILTFFIEHDGLAQEIAERGRDFIWQHLRMTDVECYWKKMLTSYQKLLKFTVKKDSELIEINTKNLQIS